MADRAHTASVINRHTPACTVTIMRVAAGTPSGTLVSETGRVGDTAEQTETYIPSLTLYYYIAPASPTPAVCDST